MHDIYIKYFKFVRETFDNDSELIAALNEVNNITSL
jgi:hypothetical protein